MRKKWHTLLSVTAYIAILGYALDFDLLMLIDIRLVFLTLLGTLILALPFYERQKGWRCLPGIFRRKALEAGFIETFLLLFSSLQDSGGHELILSRMLAEIALCFRPLLYGCLLFLLSEGTDVPDAPQESPEQEAASKKAPDIQELSETCGLTRRETQIAALILAGKSNAEIAAALFISEATVKKHVSNIFEKTGIKKREELGRSGR